MESPSVAAKPLAVPTATLGKEAPFGVNEMRLSARHWFVTFVILVLVAVLTPRVWKRIERFETGSDYRIPYELSKDYWLYEQRLSQVCQAWRCRCLGRLGCLG